MPDEEDGQDEWARTVEQGTSPFRSPDVSNFPSEIHRIGVMLMDLDLNSLNMSAAVNYPSILACPPAIATISKSRNTDREVDFVVSVSGLLVLVPRLRCGAETPRKVQCVGRSQRRNLVVEVVVVGLVVL